MFKIKKRRGTLDTRQYNGKEEDAPLPVCRYAGATWSQDDVIHSPLHSTPVAL